MLAKCQDPLDVECPLGMLTQSCEHGTDSPILLVVFVAEGDFAAEVVFAGFEDFDGDDVTRLEAFRSDEDFAIDLGSVGEAAADVDAVFLLFINDDVEFEAEE